jgi:hypothetical protein
MDVDFKVASPKGAYFNLGTNQMNWDRHSVRLLLFLLSLSAILTSGENTFATTVNSWYYHSLIIIGTELKN